MTLHHLPALLVLALGATVTNVYAAETSPKPVNTPTLDRSVLPVPEPDYPHSTVLDARDATPPPRFQVKAPETAPNVLIVLIDDMGFGMSSAFGGPVKCRPLRNWRMKGYATTNSIPPHCVHQLELPCYQVVIIT